MTLVRPAQTVDATAICEIWNEVIRNTLVTFTTMEKTPDLIAQSIGARAPAFLVATAQDGTVNGFATYGRFRDGPGYDFTKEHSVMLAPTARGQGIGRVLMAALEQIAQGQNVHCLVAAISGENSAAVGFHRSIGFVTVGTLPETGFKSGRWIDLVLMQKIISLPR